MSMEMKNSLVAADDRSEYDECVKRILSQKDVPSEYDLINRAIYLVCRMISSQKERDFRHSNFDEIKKVYSIWVVMNMNECTLNHIQLTDRSLLGDYRWKGKLDLLNIVMIGLSKKLPEKSEKYKLHRLLTTLLSRTLSVEQKLKILDEEYDIFCQNCEEVDTMCNLSEGIYEDGFKDGFENGCQSGSDSKRDEMILNMNAHGVSQEDIALYAGITVEEVKEIIASKSNEN